MDYYSAIQKTEIMPLVATWMELEMIILSEVQSDRERQIPYDITCEISKKNSASELICRTEIA